MRKSKGKTAAIFKTFDKIKGKSKDEPELVAIKDPETEEFIFSPDELKKAYLKYCVHLYRDAQIRVKTGAGMTDTQVTGENVAQGSIGGAILTSCNLDKTVT